MYQQRQKNMPALIFKHDSIRKMDNIILLIFPRSANVRCYTVVFISVCTVYRNAILIGKSYVNHLPHTFRDALNTFANKADPDHATIETATRSGST